MRHSIRLIGTLLAAALLGACAPAGQSGPLSNSLPAPNQPASQNAPAARGAPATAPASIGGAPATEPASTVSADTAPPALASLQQAAGQQVLRVPSGKGAGQLSTEGGGPQSFRIGGDGTIRVLDSANKRVLFFGQDGARGRLVTISEATSPIDFIVNNDAEVFIFDSGAKPQVLRYDRAGKLKARYPLNADVGIEAGAIGLTSEQTLMLFSHDNQRAWTVLHHNVAVPPEIQPLTEQRGTASPRSPVLFETAQGDGQAALRVIGLTGGVNGSMLTVAQRVQTALPQGAVFFNVDRAMSLYFMRGNPAAEPVDLWRVHPDGSVAGGVRIDLTGCPNTTMRKLYVDQEGAAWSMCSTGKDVTFARYTLLDSAGKALPKAAAKAADVLWRPGANFIAA